MLGRDEIRSLLREALRHAGPADADIYVNASEQALTRFANNRIHQNVYHEDAIAHIRVANGKRQGRAVTNNISASGLADAVRRAGEHARLMPEDGDFPGLPEPNAAAEVQGCDAATVSCDPDRRAAIAGLVCQKAADARLEAAGFCRTGVTELAVVSTRGADAYHAGTFAGLLITARGDDATGWSKDGGGRINDIDAESLAEEAIGKAVRGSNPQPLETGDYPVVLEHYAVDDVLEALSSYGMGAQLVQDQRSWMNSVIGEPAMSSLVSIWDDGVDPAGWPVPFDAEGVPRQRVDIVTDGIVRGPVHNNYTASKAGLASTGHQRGATGGPSAGNLFMAGGDRSTEQLIASVEMGIYVTRFYYTRLAHSRGCVMTGMTRDGTFLIENGELTTPIKNLRFTQGYVAALAGCLGLSSQPQLNLNEAGVAVRVPAASLSSWRFTGQTV